MSTTTAAPPPRTPTHPTRTVIAARPSLPLPQPEGHLPGDHRRSRRWTFAPGTRNAHALNKTLLRHAGSNPPHPSFRATNSCCRRRESGHPPHRDRRTAGKNLHTPKRGEPQGNRAGPYDVQKMPPSYTATTVYGADMHPGHGAQPGTLPCLPTPRRDVRHSNHTSRS
ncbi:hypothetical protein K1Y78_06550 [Streptomyces sp. tea 10]|nr:hypothetical protein [Streptomyces sp. tea 10]